MLLFYYYLYDNKPAEDYDDESVWEYGDEDEDGHDDTVDRLHHVYWSQPVTSVQAVASPILHTSNTQIIKQIYFNLFLKLLYTRALVMPSFSLESNFRHNGFWLVEQNNELSLNMQTNKCVGNFLQIYDLSSVIKPKPE